jgi:putative zinc finger protein
MKTRVNNISSALNGAVSRGCLSPLIGQRLSHYIMDLLADAEAEAFEEHLLLCRACREDYLRMCEVIETARANPGSFFGKSNKSGM